MEGKEAEEGRLNRGCTCDALPPAHELTLPAALTACRTGGWGCAADARTRRPHPAGRTGKRLGVLRAAEAAHTCTSPTHTRAASGQPLASP